MVNYEFAAFFAVMLFWFGFSLGSFLEFCLGFVFSGMKEIKKKIKDKKRGKDNVQ